MMNMSASYFHLGQAEWRWDPVSPHHHHHRRSGIWESPVSLRLLFGIRAWHFFFFKSGLNYTNILINESFKKTKMMLRGSVDIILGKRKR